MSWYHKAKYSSRSRSYEQLLLNLRKKHKKVVKWIFKCLKAQTILERFINVDMTDDTNRKISTSV